MNQISNSDAWAVSVVAAIGILLFLWLIGFWMYNEGVLFVLGCLIGFSIFIGGIAWFVHGMMT